MMKKPIIYIFLLAAVIAVGYGVKYYSDLSYSGGEDIKLLAEREFSSLNELLNIPEFDNKVVFVDIWGSYCSPCIGEFKHAPELKKKFSGQPVEFLYLASPYGYFNDKQVWKNDIKEYQLQGYHYFLSEEFYYQIWETIEDNPEKRYLIPRYLIIDNEGRIANSEASYPGTKDSLYQEIEEVLAKK